MMTSARTSKRPQPTRHSGCSLLPNDRLLSPALRANRYSAKTSRIREHASSKAISKADPFHVTVTNAAVQVVLRTARFGTSESVGISRIQVIVKSASLFLTPTLEGVTCTMEVSPQRSGVVLEYRQRCRY